MTTLNNVSMKTVVETFIIEETQELIYDNEKLDQWNKHVAELGLKGQTKIRKAEKSPIPFLHMKKSMVKTFETLCPRKVKLEEYDKTPIPVEILDLVLLSKNEGYFSKFAIWYDDMTPDPVCIGFAKNANWKPEYDSWDSYSFDLYLIGRWADMKACMEDLVAKAKKMFIKQEHNRLTQDIKTAERKIEDLKRTADTEFGLDDVSSLTPVDDLPF